MSALRHRRVVWIAIGLLLLLLPIFIELGRIAWICWALDSASREAVRYAVTGQFDPAYCAQFASRLPGDNDSERASKCDLTIERRWSGKEYLPEEYWPYDGNQHSAEDLCNNYLFPGPFKSVDCMSTEHSEFDFEDVVAAMQDAARLSSIYQVARDTLNKSGIAADAVTISVCSNRPGYRYDYSRDVCIPKDHPGAPFYQVLLHLTYNYTIGASWGVHFAVLPLRVTQHQELELFRPLEVCSMGWCPSPRPTPEWEP
jgi:hypothetical protein